MGRGPSNEYLAKNVKDLKVSYGGINAVKEINLYVNQGELVALIGVKGAELKS